MTKASDFRTLHLASSGFIMPNAWDAGSAIILAEAGFKAIATTSSGIAFSLGRQDYNVDHETLRVSRDDMFVRIRQIAGAVDIPVSADLEAGFGDTPEEVANTIRMAIDCGLAGANIEDRRPGQPGLYDPSLAAERIAAAHDVISSAHSDFVLCARTDAALVEPEGVGAAIERSNRYRQAGAGCLYTTGVSDLPTIRTLVDEIDGPLNLVLGLGTREGNAHEWIAAGVQRVSLGGSIARATLGLIRQAADELIAEGSIRFADHQIPQTQLNALFARQAGARP